MRSIFRTMLVLAMAALATQANAQVSFFEGEDFQGQALTTDRPIEDLRSVASHQPASSVVVTGGQWEFCEGPQHGGHCVILRPGSYPSLRAMGIRGRILSVRSVGRDPRTVEPRRPPVIAPVPMAARITLYEHDDFRGQTLVTDRPLTDLQRQGFNDRASSAEVYGEAWEVCEHARFDGRCVVLRPGRYASLRALNLNDRVSSVRLAGRDVHSTEDPRYPRTPVMPPPPLPVAAHVTFYEHDGFQGQSFTTDRQIGNFSRYGFNDRASSVVVVGERWEACEEAFFGGRCIILRPGSYGSLRAMGLNDRLSSVRPVSRDARFDDHRYAPAPIAGGPDFRRRNDERLYEVNVASVRAVVGSSEQRCWIEREQVAQDTGGANVPNAIVGAIIGGILGHQIGGGSGKDAATVGGAVAGAAIGANIGRDDDPAPAAFHEVRRCERTPSQARPLYWDVTYYFRGVEHRVQMTNPPGRSLTVNEQGEPRW